ncbi:class I SAM-dependent methyltransferase [Coralliovum pocilloporae]|uniref:class I SAM-dependent methyltransferase n=1 Tax=Coralliovum pocilloporae TaxID=3066369 RepID=UPI0033073A9A
MTDPKDRPGDESFEARRNEARSRLDTLTGAVGGDHKDRNDWFDQVYDLADGDAAGVPWADLEPKKALVDWLANNPGERQQAIDIACGLGDNAEALASHGWQTTAFDFASGAISWAGQRFEHSEVAYQVADLMDPPAHWIEAFDLVHECYTLQALQGPMREAAFSAVAALVKPGGRLLLITRTRDTESQPDGPPWPLSPGELNRFDSLGFSLVERHDYEIVKKGRSIPHTRLELLRKQGD